MRSLQLYGETSLVKMIPTIVAAIKELPHFKDSFTAQLKDNSVSIGIPHSGFI